MSAAKRFFEVIIKNSRLMREKRASSSELAQLTGQQVHALIFVRNNPNTQMRSIAESLRIELPSATSLIAKLVALDFVERQPDSNDRRLVRVVLTKKGEATFDRIMKEKIAFFEKMLSYLTDNEQETLVDLLEKLNQRMEKEYEK